MNRTIIMGTRGSKLALWQAAEVQSRLEALEPSLSITTRIIKTKGDKILDSPLAKIGGKGLFVKELEEALIRREIDLAVHSVKDIPTRMPPELDIAAYLEREDPRDVFISRKGGAMLDLPQGAVIGTSSLRRSSQIRSIRPDFAIIPLRGNLDTRIRKLGEGMCDAILVAAAGMIRLGFTSKITEYIPAEIILPAVGQGVIGVQCRVEDGRTRRLVTQLDHEHTRAAVQAERAFLDRLEGGCQVPVAAHARINHDSTLTLTGLISSLDGATIYRDHRSGKTTDAASIGNGLAQTLLDAGGNRILKEIFAQNS